MKIQEFVPTAGRVIIKKTRELTKMVEIEKPDYDNAIVENPERQDENDLEVPPPVVPTIKVKERATLGVQIGEVVAINSKDALAHGIREGDKIVYGIHTLKEFDLVKGKFGLLDVYNILGTVNEDLLGDLASKLHSPTDQPPITINDSYQGDPVG